MVMPATDPATTPPEPAPPAVALRGISKAFGATQALADVTLELRSGEVHALVGENGAGKSTLVKTLAGIYAPDTGTVELAGEPLVLRGPAHARELGIAVVHQEPRLFPDLSVAENVYMGHAPTGRFGVDWRTMRRQAEAIFTGLDIRQVQPTSDGGLAGRHRQIRAGGSAPW